VADISVPIGDLGPREFIAEGGQGRVHRLTQFQLADCPVGVAFKEYKPGATFVPAGVEAIVRVRSSLSEPDRQTLDRHAVWPLRVVKHPDGRVAGLLMPLIPDEFVQSGFSSRQNGGAAPRAIRHERELQFLFVDPDMADRLGHQRVNLQQRLSVCRSFAEALEFLASLNVVFGDISAKNALFKVGPTPADCAVILVDCDAARVTGTAAGVSQLNSPDWDPPGKERDVATHATDVYKFGLFVIRSLSPGKTSSQSRDPERVDPIFDRSGMEMLRRTVGDDPRKRPSITEWRDYLEIASTFGRPTGLSGQDRRGGRIGSGPARQGIRTPSATGGMEAAKQNTSTEEFQGGSSRIGWRKVNGEWVSTN